MNTLIHKVLAIFLLAFTVNTFAAIDNEAEIKALIPEKEGVVLHINETGVIFRDAHTASISDGMHTACPLLLICLNMPNGNLVITDRALLFVIDGRIVKKINRADINEIKSDKLGLSRGIFLYTNNYEAAGFSMNRDDFKIISGLLDVKPPE